MVADGPHRVLYHLLGTVQVPDHYLEEEEMKEQTQKFRSGRNSVRLKSLFLRREQQYLRLDSNICVKLMQFVTTNKCLSVIIL